MNALALSAAVGLLAAIAVLWPYRRSRCRICLALAMLAIAGGSVAAYDELGSPRLLPQLALSASLDREMHAKLQAHMQAVAAHPEDSGEWRRFGRDLMIAGRYGEAAAAYEQACDHGAEPETLFDVLTAHYLSAGGQVDDTALPWLQQAQARLPEHPETRYYAALRLKTLGDPHAAKAALLALQPQVPPGDPLSTLIAGEIARLPSDRTPERLLSP